MVDRILKLVVDGDVLKGVSALRDMDKELGRVEGTSARVSAAWRNMLGAGTAVVTIGTGMIATGYGLVKSYADQGSAIYDLTLRTGLHAETLSELKYAADQSGTSLEGLETGIRRMSSTVYDAAAGNQAALDTLTALGVGVDDLRGKSPDQIFELMLERLALVPDALTRSALAQDIFGRSGASLLPILDGGIDGLRDLRQEARDLGIVFDDEAAAEADAFGDDLGKLQGQIKGVGNSIARELLPVASDMVDEFQEWIDQHGDEFAREVADGIAEATEKAGEFYGKMEEIANLGIVQVAIDVVASMSGDQIAITTLGSFLGFTIAGPKGALAVAGAGAIGAGLDNNPNIWRPDELIYKGLGEAASVGAGDSWGWLNPLGWIPGASGLDEQAEEYHRNRQREAQAEAQGPGINLPNIQDVFDSLMQHPDVQAAAAAASGAGGGGFDPDAVTPRGGGGSGRSTPEPDALTAAGLAYVTRATSRLGAYRGGFDVGAYDEATEEYEAARRKVNRDLAELGLALSDLDARGLENTDTYRALEERMEAADAAVERIDLLEELNLEPWAAQIEVLRGVIEDVNEAERERLEIEKQRREEMERSTLAATAAAFQLGGGEGFTHTFAGTGHSVFVSTNRDEWGTIRPDGTVVISPEDFNRLGGVFGTGTGTNDGTTQFDPNTGQVVQVELSSDLQFAGQGIP